MEKQLILDVHDKLIVDLFAGGGGMSVAFENAFGRSPDIAINHNDDALSMHRMNHPLTRHFIADVYEVDPHGATQDRPVGWLHLSPDCTHHSQASGGQPRSKKIRGLSWVGYRWAGQVRPDVISLENVKQILKWGPLVAKRDKATGRVVKLDGSVAEPGEQAPAQQQYLVPDPKREGQTWRKFVAALEHLGYKVEWRILVAADFGGHTTRERLFMIARRDGRPITWPDPTHYKKPKKGQKRWKPASDCIDFSDLGKSIFERQKPLAPATMRRIAKGVKRYVLDNAKPFIVPIAHYNGTDTAHSIDDPLRTITAATKGGEFAMASPVLIHAGHGEGKGETQRRSHGIKDIQEPLGTVVASGGGHAIAAATLVQTGYGERERQSPRALDIDAPLGTVVGSGKHALCTADMMQANDGFNTTFGRYLAEPMTTITNSGSQQQLVTAHLAHLRGNCDARDLDEPLMTVSAGGQHHGLVGVRPLARSGSRRHARRCLPDGVLQRGRPVERTGQAAQHDHHQGPARPGDRVHQGHAIRHRRHSAAHAQAQGAVQRPGLSADLHHRPRTRRPKVFNLGAGPYVRQQRRSSHGDRLPGGKCAMACSEEGRMIHCTDDQVTSPALRYHGGKFRLAQWIMKFFPPHTTYVEPFGGAAGILIQKQRSYAEVYNDLDGDIVNFFRVLRDHEMRRQLLDLVSLTPYARSEFNEAWGDTEDPVERARRTAIRAQMGFGSAGSTKGATGFRIDTRRAYGTAQHLWAEYPQSIAAVGQRFQSVLIENRPAIEVMQQHDRNDTLHFVDPPYVLSTRVLQANGKGYYRHEMTDADHQDLLQVLLELEGMVVVSGYNSEIYNDLLDGWETFQTKSRISAGRGTALRTETVWINPACSDALHRKGGLFS
jgi:DNA (cytosine-5)-methyltransferase 1